MARTVLLADDSVTAQNMGRRILMDAGYEVITVNNGSAALKKIHESQPDLIVLDVYMPGYGGLEVCQRLKESEETQKIPVLLSVGKMEPFKTDEAKRVRADGHIVKPFEASELLAALTRLEDRIVPPAEPGRAKKKSGERKARFWHAGDDPVKAPEPWSDKIAYLAEVKERRAEAAVDPSEMPTVETSTVSPAIEPPPNPVPMESAPEMPVVAEAEAPVAQENSLSEAKAGGNEAAMAAVVDSATPPAVPDPQPEPTQPAAAAESVPAVGAEKSEATEAVVAAEAPRAVEETPKAPAESSPASSAARWVAENVAVSAEEASLALEQEMIQAQAATTAPAPNVAATSSVANASAEAFEEKGATFAAAAASTSTATSSPRPVSEPADSDRDLPGASEATAAWHNWQQIRDSVMNLQGASTIIDSAAAAAHTSASETTQDSCHTPTPQNTPAPPSTSNTEPGLESAALASIVDSVLAELKPKLMEEISKKLKK